MNPVPLPALTKNQRRILEALYEEGGLSTALIAQYVVPNYAKNRTVNALTRLRTLKLVSSQTIGVPGSEEHCWVLTYGGARALERVIIHQEARYQVPTLAQLAHKAVSVRLAATLRNLDWAYVRPAPYNSAHPKPAETPQQQALSRAVAFHFAHTAPGTAGRLHPSQVPGGLNDWVAWPADQAERPIVVILHPVGGTAHFWRTARRRVAGQEQTPARTQVYGPVSRIVPVVGLFGSRTLAAGYGPLLAAAGFRAYAAEDLPGFLLRHRLGLPTE
jgi:hypothetical protein